MATTVRIDKWLWAARFFKTRSLAAEAVNGGLVHVNGQRVKPAKNILVGDALEVRKGVQLFVVKVLALADKRGPAAVAVTLYEEAPESVAAREEKFRQAKLLQPDRQHRGKMNKKDRRLIRDFKRRDE